MRRIAFPLILAGTFAVAALGAHAVGGAAATRIVDVDHDHPFETPNATETPDASETPDAPDPSETPDAPDDSDGRSGNSGHGDGDDDDRSGSNNGPG